MTVLPEAWPDTGSDGIRCYLTLLFSDLSDSTALADGREEEWYAALLREVRELCRTVVVKHGGLVARVQSDGLLVAFGYPQPREDDSRRACEAALELHQAVASLSQVQGEQLPHALAMHSGVHAGLTLVRSGSSEAGVIEPLGDVPNTAARLCSIAHRGEIVVSNEALGADVHFFDATDVEQLSLKGRSRPLPVVRLLRRRPVTRRYEAHAVRGLAPLVGRSAEQARLLAVLQAVQGGQRHCVAVVGSPGIGKTRLVEETLRAARQQNWRTLHGYCESYLNAEPLQPFLQILRTLAEQEQGLADSAATAGELLRALAPGGAEAQRQAPGARAIVVAVSGLVDRLATDSPVLVVLDDWQWADDLSQRVLDGLLELSRPVCVLIAGRTPAGDWLVPAAAELIELAPLALDDTRRTLEHLLPGADPFVVADIHRYAGGVPLFIEELSHSAASTGLQRPADQPMVGAAWLAALVESRIKRLPPPERELVSVAAVIGNVIPIWLLQRITGLDEQAGPVRALAEQDLVFPADLPGRLRFKHGLTRDVIYAAVGLKPRMSIHLRVAEALAGDGAADDAGDALEALAYHYAAAGVDERASHFAERAGDKAMAHHALDQARAQYGATLRALDRLAPLDKLAQRRWCAIAEKLGMACVFDPLALADGVSLFERSLELARRVCDEPAVARAEYWLGYIHYSKGNAREALVHCERSLQLATSLGDEPLAAQVRATLGQALACAHQYGRALRFLDEALDSKRSRGRPAGSVAVGSAFALATKGGVLGDRGQFDAANECFGQALELLGDSAHQVSSSVRMWISAVRLWQGRWEEAEQVARASARIAEQCRSRQLLSMSRALAGYAAWAMHRRPESLKTVLEATGWIVAHKGGLVTSLNFGWLVDGAVVTGRIGDARQHAARLFQRARNRDRLGEAMGCRALARLHIAGADFARAERYLERAARAALARESPHEQAVNELVRAELAAARGRPGDALAALDAAERAFESMAMHWHRQQAMDLRRRI